MPGVIFLGQVAARLEYLDIACCRCDRRVRLLGQHGADLPMPELGRLLAVDCPRLIADRMHDVWGWRFPGLCGMRL